MADHENSSESVESEGPAAGESSARPPGADNQAGKQTIDVNDSDAIACYANFCRVSSTPEELILDLGLNPQPYGGSTKPIEISQRIIMNHYTAKRLLSALMMALERHEQAFGVLETDVRKRLRSK